MACQFCATGQAGFQRHLSGGEIVEQVAVAMREARPRRLSNVVFMGMGEPLANYDRVWSAVSRLHGEMGLSARHLTLSTVGIVPGIRRLATESLPVNLAVSLHAANDSLRDELVPINRRYPLPMLAEACAEYVAAKGRRLSIEWAMIDGVNDSPSDAEELAAFAAPSGGPREPDPTESDARLRRGGLAGGAGAPLPRRARRHRGERHRPDHQGRGDRRRLWAAGGKRRTHRRRPRRRRAGAVDQGHGRSLEPGHGKEFSGRAVVRPSLFWFLLLDGGIILMTLLVFNDQAYDRAKERIEDRLPSPRDRWWACWSGRR